MFEQQFKNELSKLKNELFNSFNPDCDYFIGYLDCITAVNDIVKNIIEGEHNEN